jgi:hypothetical protein
MQANEFDKKPQKPQKKTTQSVVASPPSLVEKKLKFKIPHQMREVTHNTSQPMTGVLPPGHSVKPGSELELIRDTDPDLWARILRWD